VAILACLAAAALLAGSRAAGEPAPAPLRVLQMNLCNSGKAGCYTGEAVAEAAAVIRDHRPDLVSLNEVCEPDVDTLAGAFRDVHRGERVVWEFRTAGDRRTGGPAECLNGDRYGNGLLARVPAPYLGHSTHSGTYPTQDPLDPEERSWLCVHAVDAFYACTTHLSYITRPVPLEQCGHLLGTVIPGLRAQRGYEPTVLAGDLNLVSGGTPDLQSCLPSGYLREDDGGVQQILATSDFAVRSRTLIDMDGTTDHPSLLISLAVERPDDG
jgi:endonuclease/exonuclease/phosphatase family protein